MEVFGLVGPSGTGKSHRAVMVAHNTNADLIVDDGLLIRGSQILGGISAKKQSTKIGAIKTALFTDEEHRSLARETIAQVGPERMLILGTSVEMVVRIAGRLGLPEPATFIKIEEVASGEEIKKARYNRSRFGKHVIPAPTFEVKRNFPNTLIDSLQVIFHRQNVKKQTVIEQSVIYPTFSSLGKFTVAENVLGDITKWVLKNFAGVDHAGKVKVLSEQGNTVLYVEFVAKYGFDLPKLCREIQLSVKEVIENYTGLAIKEVDLLITHIVLKSSIKHRIDQ